MKGSLVLTVCLLTTATSHPTPTQHRSDGFRSSLNHHLEQVFSTISHKSISWVDSIKENHGPIAAEAVEKIKQTVPEKLPEALESAISKAYEIDYADLPEEIKSWIIEHPYQTTFYIVNGIVFFYPQLITGPVLWSLGWTSAGPRAGSAAAALMSKFGVVPSKGAYAYLQSAAMGGYGGAMVQGVTRAGSGLLGGAQWLNQYLHGREMSRADIAAEVGRRHEGD